MGSLQGEMGTKCRSFWMCCPCFIVLYSKIYTLRSTCLLLGCTLLLRISSSFATYAHSFLLFLCSISILILSYRKSFSTSSSHLGLDHPYFVLSYLYATCRKVAGLIPDDVSGFLNWLNSFSRTMALRSTQPLTEMSTKSLPGGKGRPAHKDWQPHHHLWSDCLEKRGSLDFSQPGGPSRPVIGVALSLPYPLVYIYFSNAFLSILSISTSPHYVQFLAVPPLRLHVYNLKGF
jgi:hypothetical protein